MIQGLSPTNGRGLGKRTRGMLGARVVREGLFSMGGLSFFLGFLRSNLISEQSGWRTPD